MITKIELDGFKTFQNFELELGPFQVIIGPNGAGKSNLFDALRLLGRLVKSDPDYYGSGQKWLGIRSNTDRAFTISPGGEPVDRLRIAVELLVDRKVKDKLGQEEEINYRRLRYELELIRTARGEEQERLFIRNEALEPILPDNDSWAKKNKLYEGWLKKPESKREKTSFIYNELGDQDTVFTLRENNSHLKRMTTEFTLLSFVNTKEYPHALAVKQEIQKWNFLELHPFYGTNQKSPISRVSLYTNNFDYKATRNLDLPEILVRFKDEDPFLLNDVVRSLTNLVPEIVKLEVEKDTYNENVIFATTRDGRRLPWQSLSDGTLRLMALAILYNDPSFEGLLCIEEPENGVHPFVLKNMAGLLKNMATDFSDKEQAQSPLRQVLVTTHSPVLISQKEVIGNVLFAYLVTRVGGKDTPSQRITHIAPVRNGHHTKENGDNTTENTYTLYQVKKYLESAGSSEALEILEDKA